MCLCVCYWYLWKQFELNVTGGVRRTDKRGRNCCCDMFTFCWHTCIMTRARTSARSLAVSQCCHLPSYLSVISHSFHVWKVKTRKFDSNGTLKCSEKECAEWGGGNRRLRLLPVGCRSHFLPKNFSYSLDCLYYAVRAGPICGRCIINWQGMVLFWCVLVCDLQCR